ncbi:DUF7504 family protein [Halomicrobium salinisoli]|uniref:DUF7504 family protein n=1 Tax=Halomicrobium salinisoli TaxID=2878391 RepID=UPI001CF04433|nr:hypothetical protein [Halomicrobium salinisoli]
MSVLPASTGESVRPGESVLVLCSEFGVDESPICLDLLTPDRSVEEAMLSITVTESPGDRVRQWYDHADSTPAAATVIDVDTSMRSAESGATTAGDRVQCEVDSQRTLSSPSNLTKLGIEITSALDDLRATDEERQLVVCFHSLSPLFQYVSREELFKFVHLVSDELAQVDAIAHFHMDPTAHDEQTIATFLHLFDGVVERDDGDWELRTK